MRGAPGSGAEERSCRSAHRLLLDLRNVFCVDGLSRPMMERPVTHDYHDDLGRLGSHVYMAIGTPSRRAVAIESLDL